MLTSVHWPWSLSTLLGEKAAADLAMENMGGSLFNYPFLVSGFLVSVSYASPFILLVGNLALIHFMGVVIFYNVKNVPMEDTAYHSWCRQLELVCLLWCWSFPTPWCTSTLHKPVKMTKQTVLRDLCWSLQLVTSSSFFQPPSRLCFHLQCQIGPLLIPFSVAGTGLYILSTSLFTSSSGEESEWASSYFLRMSSISLDSKATD